MVACWPVLPALRSHRRPENSHMPIASFRLHTKRALRSLSALCLCTALASCLVLPRGEAVPATQTERAEAVGARHARYWLDRNVTLLVNDVLQGIEWEKADLMAAGKPAQPFPPAHMLAISGGGDAGAFGAGLLVGWTKHGSRPEFKLVSGISAGALIAPFAFLGSDYDEVLRQVSTSITPDEVYRARGVVQGIVSDGMADNRPLAALIERHVTAEVIAAVAREYRRGRFLLIGTTNLDAGRPVTWNMGKIAASNDPRALELFRKVLLASSAIPGAFSPVMIDVELQGKAHQEMHVDGGVLSQVYLYPRNSFNAVRRSGEPFLRQRHAFVIRNGKLDPNWAQTERRTLSIVERAMNNLIQAEGIKDLQQIAAAAEEDQVDFNLAYIGAEFNHPHPEEFDPAYMLALFDYGYQQSVSGYPWAKSMPWP